MQSNSTPKVALFVVLLWISATTSWAQTSFFEPLSAAQSRIATPAIQGVQTFKPYRLKTAELRRYLTKASREFQPNSNPLPVAIPLPDGTTETFALFESPILSPNVAAQHPEIKTYAGKGTTHQAYTIRLSFTASGFDAIILGVGNDAVYYTKASTDPTDQLYITYFGRDARRSDIVKPFGTTGKCGTLSPAIDTHKNGARQGAIANNTGTVLRTFRLALAATKEFTQKQGNGNVNTAFNAMVGYVNRMNAVFRTELSVAFVLVSGTSTIFTAENSGGYNNSDLDAMITRNQLVLDSAIGNDNYDIGHVLGSSGGSGEGLAITPSACISESKAMGASSFGDGSFAPIFDDQTLSHEVGHQFGMSHTFNSSIPVCTTREAKTSVEPGSGTTIMSYGYTCDGAAGNDNYETPAYQPILNFHTVSYAQAVQYVSTLSCFTSTPLNNVVPTITRFPANVTIPRSTPFVLTGEATDPDAANVLSYSWEGTDIGKIVPNGSTLANTAQPPFFRSYAPSNNGTRIFPRLSAILDGTNYAKGDKLPSVGVETTLRLTVRDGAGGLTYRTVTVTIDENSGPFLETTNLSGSYPGNSSQTITWSVANTTAPPVNCATVDILLSTDGGQTFPVTLVANTPNDGSEPVILPNVLTSNARILVAARNNVFFDISNANFSITAPAATLVKLTSPDPVASENESGGGRKAAIGARAAAANPGTLRFERNSTVGTLVVNYQIGGTATAGVDYVNLPTSITFTDGESVVIEELDPIDNDEEEEGDETAVFSLIDGDEYDLDPAEDTATILIKEKITSSTFMIVGVTNPVCQTVSANERRLSFTPQYSGLTGQPVSFSVVNEMLPTTAPGPYTLRLYTDNPAITLKATQSGSESSFVYNWLPACFNNTQPTAPFSITNVTLVNCQTVSANERRLSFTPQYSGLTGQPVSFSVVNEMLPTTAPGPYTLRLYTDNPVITLKAVQSSSESSFVYSWLSACSGSNSSRISTSEPESRLHVQLLGNPTRNGRLSVRVAGAQGQPLQLNLLDVQGQLIDSHSIEQAATQEQHTFEVSRQPTGVLLLRAMTPTQSKIIRVVKGE
ncbi:reprolysin-like metallopeptidase [Spirosoma soli]|uniref:Reprolysin-like metallopeptidase n=1 Tax=Spirosoma soli TaxID=1770529 RepID=A0ABW5MEL2_9BACT